MSRFDEEPDGDIHGECAHEIHILQAENESLKLRVAELEGIVSNLQMACVSHINAEEVAIDKVTRLQSECGKLSDAAKQALLALHFHTEQTRPIDTSIHAMDTLNAVLKEQAK